MQKDKSLEKVWKRRRYGKPTGIGLLVGEYMDRHVTGKSRPRTSIREVWHNLLPIELAEHSVPVEYTNGRLKVLVDSPSYLYELQLLNSELLEQLQQRCRGLQVKKIKFALGRANHEPGEA